MPADALGAMISSHSRTSRNMRLAAFRWSAEVLDGGAWSRPLEPRQERATARRPLKCRCLDAVVMLAQLSAVAPAGAT
jgi:hypothetical protein